MLKKGNKLNSILTGSCPRCQEENMYLDKNPYHLGKLFKMQERCGHCNAKYMMEPSFFYGAMYVSYGVGIAFAVAAFIISYLFLGSSLKTAFIAIVATMIVFYPIVIGFLEIFGSTFSCISIPMQWLILRQKSSHIHFRIYCKPLINIFI